MNHLIVFYYFASLIAAGAGLAVLMVLWTKSRSDEIKRVFLFLVFLFFHVLIATLNFYISAVAGAGFEHPAIQAIYSLLLFAFFSVFGSLIPWFAHGLVNKPWKGPFKWFFLGLSSLAPACLALPLAFPDRDYLQTLWLVLYQGYVNIVWIGLVYFLALVITQLGNLPKDERRRFAVHILTITFVFLPGLLADQFWHLMQITLGWIPRGFAFEPVYVVAVTLASLNYVLRLPSPLLAGILDPERKKALQEKFALSDREWEVLELAASGKANQEIGERLFISEGTVKNHIHKILEKTGLRSRWQLSKLIG